METMVAAIAALVTILILVKKTSGATIPSTVTRPPITDVPQSRTINSIVQEWARKTGINPNLIFAHIFVESSGDPNAENPFDPSYGLMGITPILAQDYGYVRDYRFVTQAEIDRIKNPEVNVEIGSKYLKKLHALYPFDIATQMYNCGIKGYNDGVRVPEYLAKIKKELNHA